MLDLRRDGSTNSRFLMNPISSLLFYRQCLLIDLSIYLYINLSINLPIFSSIHVYPSTQVYLSICISVSFNLMYIRIISLVHLHFPLYSAPPTYYLSRWAYTLVGAADYWFRCWEWCSGSIHLSFLALNSKAVRR